MKLNLGCGRDIKDGYVNVDRVARPGVDLTCDLNAARWPWDDGSVEEIVCADALQQMDSWVAFLNEAYRVLQPGGQVVLTVPYYTSHRAWADPAAKHRFCEQAFLHASREYRETQGADDGGLTCHFHPVEYGLQYVPLFDQRSRDAKEFMAKHYWNTVHSLSIWLTKAA